MALAVLLLGLMMLLGSASSPPEVAIERLGSIEEGETVLVTGVMVGMWKADTGSESFSLADLSNNASVRVFWIPDGGPAPSDTLSIGDEIQVRGEVSVTQVPPVLFVQGPDFWRVRASEEVLSVGTISDHWRVFEGDRLRLFGIPRLDASDGFRLSDPEAGVSVRLRWNDGDLTRVIDQQVLVVAVLRMDARTLSLVLIVEELRPMN